MKSTVARVTRADGWCVLNADDPHVARIARRVRGHVAYFTLVPGGSARVRRQRAGGGRRLRRRRRLDGRAEGKRSTRIVSDPTRRPAASPGTTSRTPSRRALPAGSACRSRRSPTPGRPDRPGPRARPAEPVPSIGSRIVIVDFAHNEAGVAAVLDVAEGIAGGAAGRAAPVTAIVGTAGDRPDDTLRGIARIAAARGAACRDQGDVALPPRSDPRGGRRRDARRRSSRGIAFGGAGLRVRDGRPPRGTGQRGRPAAVIVLLCHEEREAVFALLEKLGAKPIDLATELTTLVPRLQERPRRG